MNTSHSNKTTRGAKYFCYLLTTWLTTWFFMAQEVLACPMCAGSNPTSKDNIIVYSLITFIILAYIPFIVIYRMIRKHSR